MSVYVTGDTHGGFQRFTKREFPQQKGMGRDDYMIICGDHGGVWAGEQVDGHHMNWLEDKPFTTLFVDGNHENFDLLNAYPEQEWRGGQDAHPARGFLAQRGAQQQVDGHGDPHGGQGAKELPGGQAEENAFLVLADFFGNFDFDN